MINPLILKTVAGISAVAATLGAFTGAVYGFGLGPFSDKNVSVYMITETTNVSSTPSDSSTLNSDKDRNYFCQIGDVTDKKDETCQVKEIKLDEYSNKIIDAKKDIKTKSVAVKVSDIKVEKKYFEIIVKDSFYNKLLQASDSKLSVIYKGDNSNTKVGSLKVLFAKKENKILGQTSYSVGKIAGFKNSSVQQVSVSSASDLSGKTLTCKFPASDTTGLACKIHDIVSSNGSSALPGTETFSWSSTAATTINANKFYIFKYDSSKSKNIGEFNSKNGIIETNGSITVGSDSNINKIEISNLQSAFVLEDTTAANSYLFLL